MGKSKKVLNIIRGLAGLTWGANFDATLIHSRIDYRCMVYWSVAKTWILSKLNH